MLLRSSNYFNIEQKNKYQMRNKCSGFNGSDFWPLPASQARALRAGLTSVSSVFHSTFDVGRSMFDVHFFFSPSWAKTT